jgi:hypothetical protein
MAGNRDEGSGYEERNRRGETEDTGNERRKKRN